MKTRKSPTEPLRAAARMILATAFLTAAVNLPAETFVSGIVAGQNWTAAASPYVVTGDVSVVGLGLTIQPDVTVKFAGPYEFRVVGQLQVSGVSNAPVLFTRQDATNGWGGIVFDQADPGSFFSYAIIEGATNSGVRITGYTPPAFTNCIVRNNTASGNGGGIQAILSGSLLVLHGCLITNNVAATNGGGLYVEGTSLLTQCMFMHNRVNAAGHGRGGGIYAGNSDPAGNGDCTMRNCSIVANQDGGDSFYGLGSGIFFHSGSGGRPYWTWPIAG